MATATFAASQQTHASLYTHPAANSEATGAISLFEDLGGSRYDGFLGIGPPSVLLTVLTHETNSVEVKHMAKELMHGVASAVGHGEGLPDASRVTIKAQFYGDHTSNSATVVLTGPSTHTDPHAQAELSDKLLRAYKRALQSTPSPVFPRFIHDVLFLPSGRTIRYEGRVEREPV